MTENKNIVKRFFISKSVIDNRQILEYNKKVRNFWENLKNGGRTLRIT